jgi:hypothetical protein
MKKEWEDVVGELVKNFSEKNPEVNVVPKI